MFDDSPSYLTDGASDELFPQTTTLGDAYGAAAPGKLVREETPLWGKNAEEAKKVTAAEQRAAQAAQEDAEARAKAQRLAEKKPQTVAAKVPNVTQLPAKQPAPASYVPTQGTAAPAGYTPPAPGGFVPSTAADAQAAEAILATGADLTTDLTTPRGFIASVPVWGWVLGGAVTIGVGYAGYRWWTRKPSRFRD